MEMWVRAKWPPSFSPHCLQYMAIWLWDHRIYNTGGNGKRDSPISHACWCGCAETVLSINHSPFSITQGNQRVNASDHISSPSTRVNPCQSPPFQVDFSPMEKKTEKWAKDSRMTRSEESYLFFWEDWLNFCLTPNAASIKFPWWFAFNAIMDLRRIYVME